MKKIFNIILILVIVLGSTSCSEWLDVNTDPNNPNETSASVDIRLPWIQHYYMYGWASASMRTSTIAGIYTQSSVTSANGLLSSWDPYQSSCTTAYQQWFLGAFVNILPMIDRAEEEGAYHYLGVAYCMHAMGFMMMLDIHGEMPYTEAGVDGIYAPKYDDGETIYNGCMANLDKAIEYFNMTQNTAAPTLAEGDTWNGGDVNKWIKLCYGLKARYLLQISKKSSYDGDAVLTALASAPQSNDDNTLMKHYNVSGDATNFTVGDPYQANTIWDCLSYGTTQRATRWYANLLDNSYTGGSGVVDPRKDRLLPSIMTNVVADASGKVLSNEWRVDAGVDVMYSNVRPQGGPVNPSYAAEATDITYTISDDTERANFIANLAGGSTYSESGTSVTVTYPIGAFYINSTSYARAGDTIYVNLRSNSLSTSGLSATDTYYYINSTAGAVNGTGIFHSRPDSDSDILTYSEMCFIKAEVYMRKGDKESAHAAYLAGIQANFDRMQTKLTSWAAEGVVNPFQQPMDEADIAAYMASDAVVQSSTNLTMAEIMKQKIIALGPNLQIWNDMRRFNYSAGNIGGFGNVYPDYARPYDFTATNKITGSSPTDLTYWFRRYSQSTHESNYNNTNLMASNPLAMTDAIWSCPVWWDEED